MIASDPKHARVLHFLLGGDLAGGCDVFHAHTTKTPGSPAHYYCIGSKCRLFACTMKNQFPFWCDKKREKNRKHI